MKRHAGSFIRPITAELTEAARESYVTREDFKLSKTERGRNLRLPAGVIASPHVLREDRGVYPVTGPVRGQAPVTAKGRAPVSSPAPLGAGPNPYTKWETMTLPVVPNPAVAPHEAIAAHAYGYIPKHTAPETPLVAQVKR